MDNLEERAAELLSRMGRDAEAILSPLADLSVDPELPNPAYDRLAARLGERFVGLSFDGYPGKHPQIVKGLAEWARDYEPKGRGLYVTGPVGVGKTGLVAPTLLELARRGHRVEWLWTSEYVEACRRTVGTGKAATPPSVLLRNCGVLVLDDVGFDRVTDFAVDKISLLVNHAHRELITLVVTTNLSVGEFAAQLGERVASRVLEMTRKVEFPANAEDLRSRGWERRSGR